MRSLVSIIPAGARGRFGAVLAVCLGTVGAVQAAPDPASARPPGLAAPGLAAPGLAASGLAASGLAASVLAPQPHLPPNPIPLPSSLPGAPATPPMSGAPAPSPPPLLPDTRLDKAEVAAEIDRLRTSLAAEVPHLVQQTPDSALRWVRLARAQITAAQMPILRPQLIVVVDRAVKVQQLALLVAEPDGPYSMIGAVRVSTGQAGRFDHYVTPTGVFRHTDAILDYRAQGTYNENHIRGLGLKGMRVWDFGWQWAHKGWNPDVGKPLEIQIRLEMHATDPAVLEQRIGRTASQGCVRIPSSMNRFLDLHGVLDATYERAAVSDIRYRALLLRERTGSILAGDALVVVDSSLPPGTPPDQLVAPDHGGIAKGAAVAAAGKSG